MDLSRACVIDIESNNLLANMLTYKSFPYKLRDDAKLWCVVVTNVLTKEYDVATKEEITKDWLKTILEKYDIIIAHNGHKFDLRVLQLFGVLDYHVGYLNSPDKVFGRDVWLIDTVIWSRLFNPDRYGGHSLEAWGKRVGNEKTDFREKCIENGIISKDDPKGAEFRCFSDIMVDYCVQDTMSNVDTFIELLKDFVSFPGWRQASKMEHKLADLGLNRETLGFKFDKDLAVKCLEDLTLKIESIAQKINPILPPKKMTKGEKKFFTPPVRQVNKDGELSSSMVSFINRVGGTSEKTGLNNFLFYKDKKIRIPFLEPLETHSEATIENFDHVKMFLIENGWEPTEWRIRDLTKDAKKQKIPLEKSIKALDKWYVETMEGKYFKSRIKELGFKEEEHEKMYLHIRGELENEKFSVIVPTSPSVRVGIEKELCPNLVKLGDRVWFAKEFALFLTYRHRKSSIAGGDIEDMDFDLEVPNKGYLANYREEDGRIPTPAIELGASSGRYTHISVTNVPRLTSEYGKEMRSLFGCGDEFVQLGFDFSSLEARVQGSYVYKYTDGEALAESLVAEKPNDIHSKNSRKLNIDRSVVKSVAYAILYGCSVGKLQKMLSYSKESATKFYEDYWDAVPALRDLKKAVEDYWERTTNKSYLPGADGRKLITRSKHSLLNTLFQSCGVINAKYTTVFMFEDLENQGFCISPFEGLPDVCSMCEYHDENQLAIKKGILKHKLFETEEEANLFVENWDKSLGQISAVGHSEKGYYVCLPNVVSTAIEQAIKKAEKVTRLNVSLGYEWITGKNWAQCH